MIGYDEYKMQWLNKRCLTLPSLGVPLRSLVSILFFNEKT